MILWLNLGLSGHSSHAVAWRSSHLNGTLARLRIVRMQQSRCFVVLESQKSWSGTTEYSQT
eukprot:546426-Pyramimonas_sp.AAC.1